MRTILAERPFGPLPVFRGGPAGRVQHAAVPLEGVQGDGCQRRIFKNNPAVPGNKLNT